MSYAIVTGGSKGIGRAIVRALAKEGILVVFTYKSGGEEAKHLLEELTNEGLQGKACPLDITDYQACRSFTDMLYREMGAPDILVNNAGITEDSLLFAMKKEQWDDVINTDLNGVFHLTQQVAFHMMRGKKGRIINISSIGGIAGVRGQCNYSAAKAAVIGFTKALAKETATFGIAVNVIAPGGVETEMTEKMGAVALEQMIASIPAGRLCRAEEVGQVAAWLSFSAPIYLSGATITLDGGMGSL